MNKDYEASKEDLSYFKDNFETIIFDESFFKIFDYEKFKRLILRFLKLFWPSHFYWTIILSYSLFN